MHNQMKSNAGVGLCLCRFYSLHFTHIIQNVFESVVSNGFSNLSFPLLSIDLTLGFSLVVFFFFGSIQSSNTNCRHESQRMTLSEISMCLYSILCCTEYLLNKIKINSFYCYIPFYMDQFTLYLYVVVVLLLFWNYATEDANAYYNKPHFVSYQDFFFFNIISIVQISYDLKLNSRRKTYTN